MGKEGVEGVPVVAQCRFRLQSSSKGNLIKEAKNREVTMPYDVCAGWDDWSPQPIPLMESVMEIVRLQNNALCKREGEGGTVLLGS